jgi:hypothetical protein
MTADMAFRRLDKVCVLWRDIGQLADCERTNEDHATHFAAP